MLRVRSRPRVRVEVEEDAQHVNPSVFGVTTSRLGLGLGL